jgi:uncharacterized protein
LADRFVKDPNEIVKVQQRVSVTVLEVDLARNRISLSMRENPDMDRREAGSKSRPKGRPNRPPQKQKPKPAPFNSAFAEAFKKSGK